MNAPAHLSPVVKVIDPLSEPSAPRAIPYALSVAFAASGAILPQMPGLMKLQRAQTFADTEDLLRAVLLAEKYRNRKQSDIDAAAERAARSAAASATWDRKRNEQLDGIIAAIQRGHKTAHTIRAAMGLSVSRFDKLIKLLRDAERVRVWQNRNVNGIGGFHHVYEVTQ